MKKIALITAMVLLIPLYFNCDNNTTVNGSPPENPGYYNDIGTTSQLTDLPGEEFNPSWSPDGSKIVFQYGSNGLYEVYILDINSGDSTQLTDNYGENPCWSPDGTLILYDGIFAGDKRAIYTISPEGSEPTLITKGIEELGATDACWFPEMDRIAFSSKSTDWFYDNAQSLYVMELPDGEPTLFKWADYYQYYRDSAISSDGAYFACSYYQEEEPLFYQDYYWGLFVWEINDGTVFFEDEAPFPSPSWSPDSDEIAYKDEPNIYQTDIFIYSFAETEKRRVTDVSSEGLEIAVTPAWSPDGTKIAYAAKGDYGGYDLWVVELNDR